MKRALVPLLALTVVAIASRAGAQEESTWRRSRDRRRDPRLMIELRLGPFRPNVDDGVGSARDQNGAPVGGGPFQQIFGDSRRVLFTAEVDWEAIHLGNIATLGVGGMVGYTSMNGKALRQDTGQPSDEDATLTLYPMAALGVARLQVLVRELGIPIVPYAKVGPAITFWSSSNGTGTSRAPDGTLGRGHTAGYMYAFGGMFLLDIIDRQSAKTFAVEQGVQHSYLFAEYTVSELRGLGQTSALYLGDKTWNAGFAFEL